MRLYLFSEYLIMQVLLESIVIVYVKMMAKLQCAGTLTMTNTASMTAVQMKGMSIVKYTASVVPVRHLEECIWVIILPFAAMWRKV